MILSPTETFVMVQAEGISSRGAAIAQKSVDLRSCSGSVTVSEYVPPSMRPGPVTPSAPAFPSMTPTLPGGTTFETSYVGIDFGVNYRFDNAGMITGIEINPDSNSITFNLEGVEAGEMLLSIPRGLIDADGDLFMVLVSASPEVQVDYEIVDSTSEYVTIKIMLPEGATTLTIVGTSVVPEFGVLAMVILGASITAIVALSRRNLLVLAKPL